MLVYADDFIRMLLQTHYHGTAKISVNNFTVDSIKTSDKGDVVIYSSELENVLNNLKVQINIQNKLKEAL